MASAPERRRLSRKFEQVYSNVVSPPSALNGKDASSNVSTCWLQRLQARHLFCGPVKARSGRDAFFPAAYEMFLATSGSVQHLQILPPHGHGTMAGMTKKLKVVRAGGPTSGGLCSALALNPRRRLVHSLTPMQLAHVARTACCPFFHGLAGFG